MSTNLQERPGAVTFRGTPMTLTGPEVRQGQPAPQFSVTTNAMAPLSLAEATDAGSRAALLITVPSLDTPTCSRETLTFHERIAELPSNVSAFVVSADLPFAQARWANEHGAQNLQFVSDYRDGNFGRAYGIEIKELALLARAIFLVRPDGTIAYTQLVKEVADEPDYDEVFSAIRSLPS